MKIKTPVYFDDYHDLADADGETILSVDLLGEVSLETRQAIIDAFENDARWRFLMAAFDDPNGPESLAGKAVEAQFLDEEDLTGAHTTKLIDAARAHLAALAT